MTDLYQVGSAATGVIEFKMQLNCQEETFSVRQSNDTITFHLALNGLMCMIKRCIISMLIIMYSITKGTNSSHRLCDSYFCECTLCPYTVILIGTLTIC